MANNFVKKKSREEKPLFVISTWDEVHPATAIKLLSENTGPKPHTKTVSFSDEPQYFVVSRTEPVSRKTQTTESPATVSNDCFLNADEEISKHPGKIAQSILKKTARKNEKEGSDVVTDWRNRVGQTSYQLHFAKTYFVESENFMGEGEMVR